MHWIFRLPFLSATKRMPFRHFGQVRSGRPLVICDNNTQELDFHPLQLTRWFVQSAGHSQCFAADGKYHRAVVPRVARRDIGDKPRVPCALFSMPDRIAPYSLFNVPPLQARMHYAIMAE
jgi:hypothetical protein